MSDEKKRFKILALIAVIFGFIGFFFPELDFTPIQYINATNVSYSGIVLYSGNISDINDIDNLYMQFNESSTPFYINVNFTNITHFSYIEVKAIYFSLVGTPSQHEIEIELWCEGEQNYIDLTEIVISPDETYFTRRFPDSMHFIRPDGNVTIRFNHTSNGNTNHRLRLNTVWLINQSQYSQIAVTTNNYYNNTTGTGSQNLSQVLAQGNNATNQNINLTNGTIYINDQSIDKLMFHYIVPANTTWVNITGLNISRDRFYDITNQLTCRVDVGNLYLYINNDYNNSNYTRQYVLADDTVHISDRDNSPGVSACSAGLASTGKQRIILDPFGKTHMVSEVGLRTGSVFGTALLFFNGDYSYDKTITNINNISFYADATNGIGYGSEFWIYRS